jgi:hypothetical protein
MVLVMNVNSGLPIPYALQRQVPYPLTRQYPTHEGGDTLYQDENYQHHYPPEQLFQPVADSRLDFERLLANVNFTLKGEKVVYCISTWVSGKLWYK